MELEFKNKNGSAHGNQGTSNTFIYTERSYSQVVHIFWPTDDNIDYISDQAVHQLLLEKWIFANTYLVK